MNLEWVDLNGEVQKEGSLANRAGLKVGDTCTILVDAKTQSRRVLSKSGSVFAFVLGIIICMISLKFTAFFYGKEK